MIIQMNNKKFNYMSYPGIVTELLPTKIKEIPLETILFRVCELMHQDLNIVKTRLRKREVVLCRQMYYYFARKYSKESLEKIGRIMNFDHATVLNGIKHMNDLIATDMEIKHQVEAVDSEISQYFYKPNT